MNIDSIISAISVIISAVTAITSLIIANKTLKATYHSIDEANRPYVVAYVDSIFVTTHRNDYLIIKNFGKSGAVIDSVTVPSNYHLYGITNDFISSLKNCFIAPNQSFMSSFTTMHRDGISTFKIKYHDGQKSYEDTFSFNEMICRSCVFSKSEPKEATSLEKAFYHCTEEFLRKDL